MATLCSHCALPLGRGGREREVHGEPQAFCCYGCCLAFQLHHGSHEEPEAAAWLIRLGVGAFLAMNVMLFSLLLYAGAFDGDDSALRRPVQLLVWSLSTPLLLLLGGPFLHGSWVALRERRLGADVLVSLGVLAAYGFSAWQVMLGADQLYFDTATMVLLLFTLGRYLQAQARARAARSLAPMLVAERATVRVIDDQGQHERPLHAVRAGDQVVVLPGERIAIDGRVLEGRSEVDESVLSGQSLPSAKAAGSAVVAGCVNGNGRLLLIASCDGDRTRWVQVGRVVREALAAKSLLGDSVDRAAALFVPAVLMLAAASATFWWLRGDAQTALSAGLAVLVVACPCSLGLAAALSGTLALAAAAQRGILVRSGAALERLATLRVLAFDKTGTLTHARLQLRHWRVHEADESDVRRRAAALARVNHPVAVAIAAAAADPGGTAAATAIVADPGAGIHGLIDGQDTALGSAAFMAARGLALPPELAAPSADESGCTRCFIGWAGQVRARISLETRLLPEAAAVLATLRRRGLAVQLLSGDGPEAVAAVAATLHIDDWHAGLLPHDKLQRLRDTMRSAGPAAMVGDGLNDGPVLAAASVGIAVGGATDLAKESADIVLPAGGIVWLPWLFEQAAALRLSVRTNLAWAFGYNALALALAASGTLQPVLAAALMAGSTLLVALRSWQAQRRSGADQQLRSPLPALQALP